MSETIIKYVPKTDASKWGLTDLYPTVKKELHNIIKSGAAFETDELSSTKEIGSWKMNRYTKNGNIHISVWCGMDEGFDLVNDAFYECGLDEQYKLDDEEDVYPILDEFCGNGDNFETMESAVISGNSTLKDILKKVDELYELANNTLENWYDDMKTITTNHCLSKE